MAATSVIGCMSADDGDGAPPADLPETRVADEGCPAIFRQGEFPAYRVTISDQEWAALNDEFLNRDEREAQGLDPKPYHPVEKLEYNGVEVPEVMIRLKGESSWRQAVALDDQPKMQFVIAFNEIDKDGRFEGVRKVELDMPRDDESFLRQRLALYYLRQAGVTAQCANSARLYINGDYYGLYTHIERLDKEFLQRHYGDMDEGDLWKGARFIKTNEETFTWDRLDQFWTATSADELAAISDLENGVAVWAHEAVPPHGDGVYNGRANFYLYDHPVNGFTWIPHDLDAAFSFLPPDHSPLYPECENRWPDDRYHWGLVMGEDRWVDFYMNALADARAAFDPDHLEELVSGMADQVHDAAFDDPMKPFPNEFHTIAVDNLYHHPRARAAELDRWLTCWRDGGEDIDGDGYAFCNDCSDDDPSRHPGAEEVCNGLDDNCDGRIDEVEGC